jgi:hypothetical protein
VHWKHPASLLYFAKSFVSLRHNKPYKQLQILHIFARYLSAYIGGVFRRTSEAYDKLDLHVMEGRYSGVAPISLPRAHFSNTALFMGRHRFPLQATPRTTVATATPPGRGGSFPMPFGRPKMASLQFPRELWSVNQARKQLPRLLRLGHQAADLQPYHGNSLRPARPSWQKARRVPEDVLQLPFPKSSRRNLPAPYQLRPCGESSASTQD